MNLTGGPLHCGNPMMAAGGYQCGGRSAYVAFRCDYCRKLETHWGEIKGEVGHERWVPRKPLTLVVLMVNDPNTTGVICTGICNDVTQFIFLYTDANTAVQNIGKKYGEAQGYKVHFNLPEPKKENA